MQVVLIVIQSVIPLDPADTAVGAGIDWNAILTPLYRYLVVVVVHKVSFHAAVGATPGKLMMGMILVSESGERRVGFLRLLVREPLFVILLSVPLLNLVWFLFTAGQIEYRGWHDRVWGSVVMISA